MICIRGTNISMTTRIEGFGVEVAELAKMLGGVCLSRVEGVWGKGTWEGGRVYCFDVGGDDP